MYTFPDIYGALRLLFQRDVHVPALPVQPVPLPVDPLGPRGLYMESHRVPIHRQRLPPTAAQQHR